MITLDYVKSKSASKLSGLHPVVLAATERLIERTYAQGVTIIITQGLRTVEEQNYLYALGRTKPGKIVTNARGGYSNHNFGVAIDFALLMPDGKVSWVVNDNWMKVVGIAKELGFEWGGSWKTFKDYPHFEMTFGLTTSQFRAGKQPSQAQISEAYKKINGEMEDVEKAKVYVNGEKIEDGFVLEGRVYVPLRAAGEAFGAKVNWDNDKKIASITK
ncbi:M15 family metallopeptidase [Paenibacillus puldeungensis]|uniref:M15 family metallopeptidase n=1 Tax=Paenibacillus puldeungensis TaxID=696536 RepID=A0ABW3S3Y7_9BACL